MVIHQEFKTNENTLIVDLLKSNDDNTTLTVAYNETNCLTQQTHQLTITGKIYFQDWNGPQGNFYADGTSIDGYPLKEIRKLIFGSCLKIYLPIITHTQSE